MTLTTTMVDGVTLPSDELALLRVFAGAKASDAKRAERLGWTIGKLREVAWAVRERHVRPNETLKATARRLGVV